MELGSPQLEMTVCQLEHQEPYDLHSSSRLQ
jgi:hypothetical protein